MLAVSTDDKETMAKFRAELGADYPFIPDPDAKLVKLFDTKTPLLPLASRRTFVIGEGRKVLAVQSGSDAIEPGGAISSCPLRKPDGGAK